MYLNILIGGLQQNQSEAIKFKSIITISSETMFWAIGWFS